MIEGGNAKGIILEDGTQIEAKQAVISSVDPYQLCFDLIGKEHLDFKILSRIENLERDWICITWYLLLRSTLHRGIQHGPRREQVPPSCISPHPHVC